MVIIADYCVLGLQDEAKWERELVELVEVRPDIHFLPGYCGLYDDLGEVQLFVYRDGDNTLLYPYILRKVPLPPGSEDLFTNDYFDITSPYGYGGPLGGQFAGDKFWGNFCCCFSDYCRQNRIITEFIRFHPILGNHIRLTGHLNVQKVSCVVSVDLTLNEQEIWSGYERNNRKNIRKAGRSGIKVIIEDNPGHFQDFIEIYHHTLARNGASQFYYFNDKFYSSIHHKMKGHFIYAYALKEGCIISAELLLYNDNYLHSFLGGTLDEFYELRPNNILKHEVIMWARQKGIKHFLLGGGYRENDGIFRYKRCFARNGVRDFYVGKKVHDPLTVARLEECFTGQQPIHKSDYFPGYRRY